MRDDIQGWARIAPAIVLVMAAAALGFALVMQFFFDLTPCPLCIWQRWPYVAAIAIGLLGLGAGRRTTLAWSLRLAALAFAVTAGIGVFHFGVEQHWWEGLKECAAGPAAGSLDALRNQLLGKPVARCDEIAWSFLGLSMAGWNVVVASLFTLFSLGAARDAANP